MSRRRNLLGSCSEPVIPSNQIWYTSTDRSVVTPYAQDVFGVNIVSNIYNGNKGIITFDGDVTAIGKNAFYDCSSLTSITIPDGVTSIGVRAFDSCSSMTSITIPDSVTSIVTWAFDSCSSLTSITIPDSVTEIGSRAFQQCSSLESVYCKPTTPPSIGSNVFDNNASGRKIYVPAESVEMYKADTNWSKYASYIVGYDF